jgi:hypothetical protein
MRAITLLQRRRLISHNRGLMQKPGEKTRTSKAADPEKARLYEGEEDPAARHAVVPLKTENRV